MIKMNLQRPPGSDFGSRAKNVQNEFPNSFWERFREQGAEMLNMNLQRSPGKWRGQRFGSKASLKGLSWLATALLARRITKAMAHNFTKRKGR